MLEGILVVVVLAVAAFFLAPWAAERLRRPMDVEEERFYAPGEFAKLSQGITHYRWFGPEDGKLIVCVHGLSTPAFGYEGLALGLAQKGWRVLTYDLYGRGYSDNATGDQNLDFFLTQLGDLLAHQKITGKFSLVGYSMGGMIVAGYAARNPDRLERLMTLAAGGVAMPNLDGTRLQRAFPYLGWWTMIVLGGWSLRKYIMAEDGADPVRDRQLQATRRRGYWPALYSSQQHIIRTDFEALHRTIGDNGTPYLAIWAKQDQVIPIQAVGTLSKWNRAARQGVLEDANHGLTYAHPARITLLFDSWARGI